MGGVGVGIRELVKVSAMETEAGRSEFEKYSEPSL